MTPDESTHGMEGRTQAVPKPEDSGGAVLLHASLVVIDGWEIGRRFELGRPRMVIGRNLDCEICLPLASISRKHALIEHQEDGDRCWIKLTDHGSTNGVFVNGEETPETALRSGDVVRLGEVAMKFVLGDSAEGRFYHEMLRRLRYDDLTGLLTRESFRSAVEEILARPKTNTHCLAMTDLDGLKAVNDAHGHLAGAAVIREMGVLMRELLGPKDYGGLYGGDEAMLLFTDTNLDAARQRAEALRRRIESHRFEFEGRVVAVTISQGLAEWPVHGRTHRELVAAADRALYAAKAAGRNCVRAADE
jgi:diguanylate cyclase (GGDEF)-like protein